MFAFLFVFAIGLAAYPNHSFEVSPTQYLSNKQNPPKLVNQMDPLLPSNIGKA